MDLGRRSFPTPAGWFFVRAKHAHSVGFAKTSVGSFRQNAPPAPALMLRSIAACRERRCCHTRTALRCVSKHEGTRPSPVLILRDARTRVRVCGNTSVCALLRMRTSIAFQPSSRCQTAHLVPAARFCARGLRLCFTHPEPRGGRSAESRSGAAAPVGRAHDAARQAPSEAPCVP